MIEKINENSIELEILDNLFDNFDKDKVIFDIRNNAFTNYCIYKIDNKIVAYINYQVMYERSELININVLEEYQNLGIGSKLMEYILNDLKIKEVKNMTLEVRVDNIKAISLYKKYGFIEIGVRKGYYQGIDGILMKKELI